MRHKPAARANTRTAARVIHFHGLVSLMSICTLEWVAAAMENSWPGSRCTFSVRR